MNKLRDLQMKNLIKLILKKINDLIIRFNEVLMAERNKYLWTNYRRWKRVGNETNKWDNRNQIIASYIPNGSTVLDLGAGSQTLQKYLNNCTYQPADLFVRTSDTLFCDFNKGIFPEVKQLFDYVVCSGVLEYIQSPDEFLNHIKFFGKSFLISYAILLPNQRKTSRLAQGWVNHFTQTELEKVFADSGYKAIICDGWENQVIYHLYVTCDVKSK